MVNLLRWATLLLFKPAVAHGAELWVVKFRSWCIHIVDLLVRAFPAVRNLFVYRDLRPWLFSSARAFLPLLPPEGTAELQTVATSLAEFVPLLKAYLAEPGAQVAPIELLPVSAVEAALGALAQCGGYVDVIRGMRARLMLPCSTSPSAGAPTSQPPAPETPIASCMHYAAPHDPCPRPIRGSARTVRLAAGHRGGIGRDMPQTAAGDRAIPSVAFDVSRHVCPRR